MSPTLFPEIALGSLRPIEDWIHAEPADSGPDAILELVVALREVVGIFDRCWAILLEQTVDGMSGRVLRGSIERFIKGMTSARQALVTVAGRIGPQPTEGTSPDESASSVLTQATERIDVLLREATALAARATVPISGDFIARAMKSIDAEYESGTSIMARLRSGGDF